MGLAVVAAVWAAGVASLLRDRAVVPEVSIAGTRSTAPASGAHAPVHAPGPSAEAPAGRERTTRSLDSPRAPSRCCSRPSAPPGTSCGSGTAPASGPLGYLDVQAGWRNGFDGGSAFARFVGDKFTSFPSALAGVGLIVGVGLVLWLYAWAYGRVSRSRCWSTRGTVTALALCASSYFGSKPRLLMPAFPLVLPLALALSRLRTCRSAWVGGRCRGGLGRVRGVLAERFRPPVTTGRR